MKTFLGAMLACASGLVVAQVRSRADFSPRLEGPGTFNRNVGGWAIHHQDGGLKVSSPSTPGRDLDLSFDRVTSLEVIQPQFF